MNYKKYKFYLINYKLNTFYLNYDNKNIFKDILFFQINIPLHPLLPPQYPSVFYYQICLYLMCFTFQQIFSIFQLILIFIPLNALFLLLKVVQNINRCSMIHIPQLKFVPHISEHEHYFLDLIKIYSKLQQKAHNLYLN